MIFLKLKNVMSMPFLSQNVDSQKEHFKLHLVVGSICIIIGVESNLDFENILSIFIFNKL
jgi:hypothetical protein